MPNQQILIICIGQNIEQQRCTTLSTIRIRKYPSTYRMKYEYLIQSEFKCPNIVLMFYQQGILIPNNTRKLPYQLCI